MGHQKNKGMHHCSGRPLSRRRGYMPEPCEVLRPSEDIYQIGYCQEIKDGTRTGRDKNKSSFNFTHTSCIMAIRNYVEKMQNSKQKRKRNVPAKENADKLICSLKNDIQMISKYEEEAVRNPGKHPTDPFFVLSAMMCKINKLERILTAQNDCRDQLARRRDMILMAKCIKKSLLDQAQCDEQFLQEKQRKMICLVRSLDKFEKDIRCATRGIKKLCCPQEAVEPEASGAICNCIDKEKCAKECIGRICIENFQVKPISRSPSRKRLSSDPCREQSSKDRCISDPGKDPSLDLCKDQSGDPCKKYDITGLKVTYTKSHVQKDSCGEETEEVKNQLCCEVNEEEKCKVTVIKDGATTSSEECNPILRQKMNHLSKIWMESARQLIDVCTTY